MKGALFACPPGVSRKPGGLGFCRFKVLVGLSRILQGLAKDRISGFSLVNAIAQGSVRNDTFWKHPTAGLEVHCWGRSRRETPIYHRLD